MPKLATLVGSMTSITWLFQRNHLETLEFSIKGRDGRMSLRAKGTWDKRLNTGTFETGTHTVQCCVSDWDHSPSQAFGRLRDAVQQCSNYILNEVGRSKERVLTWSSPHPSLTSLKIQGFTRQSSLGSPHHSHPCRFSRAVKTLSGGSQGWA